MDILIDFDGTVVKHEFPKIGKDIGAVPVLKELIENGHNLILFTMRSDIVSPKSNRIEIVCKGGKYLTDAVRWFNRNGIFLYGIQTNPTQKTWTTSPKAYGQIMIDDSAIGCPLIYPKKGRPFVDWQKVREILINQGVIK
jgi:hypothetical protein